MTTRYEVIATKAGKSVHIAFTARKTRQSLWSNMTASADKIAAELNVSDEAGIASATADAITLTDGLVVRFSGRTEGDFIRGQVA